jgi:hypothetical protein
MDRQRDRQRSSARCTSISSSVESDAERAFGVASRRQNNSAPHLRLGRFSFKAAETAAELDQVHRLNYETFVCEVAQHSDPGTGRLIDKFHHKNTYLIATLGDAVVGMAAAHDSPPFSIADRLLDPTILERPGERPLEVRLFAVRPGYQHGPVFSGLIWAILQHAQRFKHTRLLVSGLRERVSIYAKIGVRTLGPAVAFGRATFVAMTLELESPPECLRRKITRWKKLLIRASSPDRGASVSRLPGPIQICPGVRAAGCDAPVSQRADGFVARYERVRERLSSLVHGAPGVDLFAGSGTLVNDVVAATLAADRDSRPGTRSPPPWPSPTT